MDFTGVLLVFGLAGASDRGLLGGSGLDTVLLGGLLLRSSLRLGGEILLRGELLLRGGLGLLEGLGFLDVLGWRSSSSSLSLLPTFFLV